MKDFEIVCKKCGSKDIILEIEEKYPEPDTMHFIIAECNKCKTKETID